MIFPLPLLAFQIPDVRLRSAPPSPFSLAPPSFTCSFAPDNERSRQPLPRRVSHLPSSSRLQRLRPVDLPSSPSSYLVLPSNTLPTAASEPPHHRPGSSLSHRVFPLELSSSQRRSFCPFAGQYPRGRDEWAEQGRARSSRAVAGRARFPRLHPSRAISSDARGSRREGGSSGCPRATLEIRRRLSSLLRCGRSLIRRYRVSASQRGHDQSSQ